MYRVYYNSQTYKVMYYEHESTSVALDNSFLVAEIPQGEGMPYADVDAQTVYFIMPTPELALKPTPEERLATLEAENKLLKAQSQALSSQLDFQEEVITELILTVVP